MTGYTFPITKEMVTAKSTVPASERATDFICKELNSMKFAAARKLLGEVLEGKRSFGGKYHTKAATEVAKLISGIESNARARNIDPDPMQLFISTHNGPKLLRLRHKRRFGMRIKIAHVQAVLTPVKK